MNFFTQTRQILENLVLNSAEAQFLMTQLMGEEHWYTYNAIPENRIDVQIRNLGRDRYFAIINCDNLCGLEDKQLFVKTAVEFLLKQKKIPLTFNDIGIAGMVGYEGRLAFLSKLTGATPPATHAYAIFKMPGNNQVFIEDPRTGLFDRTEKLQSRTNDQVCCFAATALFYLGYKAVAERGYSKTTPELFAELYQSNALRILIQTLESKVGKSLATKQQIICSFVKQLDDFDSPITAMKPRYIHPPVEAKLSYADVVRNHSSKLSL